MSEEQRYVSYEFDDYNNLRFEFEYGEIKIYYEIYKPYLHNEEYWKGYIDRFLSVSVLRLETIEDIVKEEPDKRGLSIVLPGKFIAPFRDLFQRAMRDPRMKEEKDIYK